MGDDKKKNGAKERRKKFWGRVQILLVLAMCVAAAIVASSIVPGGFVERMRTAKVGHVVSLQVETGAPVWGATTQSLGRTLAGWYAAADFEAIADHADDGALLRVVSPTRALVLEHESGLARVRVLEGEHEGRVVFTVSTVLVERTATELQLDRAPGAGERSYLVHTIGHRDVVPIAPTREMAQRLTTIVASSRPERTMRGSDWRRMSAVPFGTAVQVQGLIDLGGDGPVVEIVVVDGTSAGMRGWVPPSMLIDLPPGLRTPGDDGAVLARPESSLDAVGDPADDPGPDDAPAEPRDPADPSDPSAAEASTDASADDPDGAPDPDAEADPGQTAESPPTGFTGPEVPPERQGRRFGPRRTPPPAGAEDPPEDEPPARDPGQAGDDPPDGDLRAG